jgi:subtilisin family serine protease
MMAWARSPRVTRRFDLTVPAGVDMDEVLRDLRRRAAENGLEPPRELDRRDKLGRLRAELVGPAHLVARILDPSAELAGYAREEGDVRRVLDRAFRARVLRDEVLPPPHAAADPVYPDPAPLRRIGAPWDPGVVEPREASTRDEQSPKVIVAIVDSGTMTGHDSLEGSLWEDPAAPGDRGYSVLDSSIEDEDGHGTLLAGTVLAAANRSPAVKLMTLKFIDGRTRPDADRAARAIEWALGKRAHIINLSFELGMESSALTSALEHARTRGVLVVVAAGNSGADNDELPVFPAYYGQTLTNVITVMATDRFDDKPGFSNYGSRKKSVHIAAPGVGVVSTHQYLSAKPSGAHPRLDHRYQRYDGTSASAAYVAGAAAFLKVAVPGLGPEDLKKCLMATADWRDLPCQSEGRLNLGRALECAFGCTTAGGQAAEATLEHSVAE